MKDKLIAFWSYDTYPYCLYDKVIDIDDRGRVRVEGYGEYKFTPILITSYEHGARLIEEIELLKTHYYKEQEELKNKYNEILKEKASFIFNKGE